MKQCPIPEYCKEQYQEQEGLCNACIIHKYSKECEIEKTLRSESLQIYLEHNYTCKQCQYNNRIIKQHQQPIKTK